MFENRKLKKERQQLRDENTFLRERLARQEQFYQQWDNLLHYDGKPQPETINRGVENEI